MSSFDVYTPIDSSLLFSRNYDDTETLLDVVQKAKVAQKQWKTRTLEERRVILDAFVADVVENKQILARELTQQMGRPIRYCEGEIRGFEFRAKTMMDMAAECLQNIVPTPQDNFCRYIQKVPLGVVLLLSPWNYPYLTTVNVLIPALISGNTVILKHSEQTALCAERLMESANRVGIPEGVFQIVHCTHDQVAELIQHPDIDFVAFTGSVEGGFAVHQATSRRGIDVGLELGGKDPAYVREDTDLVNAVENLVDGAFFNSGQSCCGIERIYVHHSLYQKFVDLYVQEVKKYVLGDPLDEATTLGPMVRTKNADFVRRQIEEAVEKGATLLVDSLLFEKDSKNSPYLAPQVLVDVTHDMSIMTDESFGPVVGIMSVQSDEEAISLMNDSQFGLTASIWTSDMDKAVWIGEQLETGTVFMNRCDYLDPELAWVGVKNSGKGCTLSKVGFEHLTRPKSFHLKNIS